ncbi:DUF6370 family protein [uncultured Flavobacterium sp.]|jgi:hypothetical protein|uniref:DUF6370 family protein n=1 Tax=uncultured Flavobacterium sp. TaxID=165435 RepID=UPI0030CA4063|tara:strand:- start:2845 stop:3165 length:321 start_codon:yes stop_codon:yes gene_type:complete
MKNSIVLLFALFSISAFSQEKKIKFENQIVEVSCGQCQFEMNEKKGCDLAVRIDGKAYFIEGTTIDDHGDAHAHNGFCAAVRKAKVSGEIENKIFKVTNFVLLPTE